MAGIDNDSGSLTTELPKLKMVSRFMVTARPAGCESRSIDASKSCLCTRPYKNHRTFLRKLARSDCPRKTKIEYRHLATRDNAKHGGIK